MSVIQLQGVNVMDKAGGDSVYGSQVNTIPDVANALRKRKRFPLCNAQVYDLNDVSVSEYWVCTLPKGHPDYCPHMAGDAGTPSRVLGIWYDDQVIARYSLTSGQEDYPARDNGTSIQCVRFTGKGVLPDGTRIGLNGDPYDGTGTACRQSNQAGQYSCTLRKGHVEYCPHMGASGYVTGIWYGDKTLKRFGLLPEGVRYPGTTPV